jgi:hypothetical protein
MTQKRIESSATTAAEPTTAAAVPAGPRFLRPSEGAHQDRLSSSPRPVRLFLGLLSQAFSSWPTSISTAEDKELDEEIDDRAETASHRRSNTESGKDAAHVEWTRSPMRSHQDRLSSSPRPVRLFLGLLSQAFSSW